MSLDDFLVAFEEDEDVLGDADEYAGRGIFNKRGVQSSVGPDDATFAEVEIADSFLSATFSTILPLDDTKSLLIMVIRCHPTTGQRFTNATLTWQFKAAPQPRNVSEKATKPRIVSIAPEYSLGGRSEEQVKVAWGVAAPVTAGFAGASAGVEASVQREKQKAVIHAMTMQGTVRANGTRCTWTVEENESSEQGIPPQFQVAVVLNHQGPFLMGIDAKATLKGKLWPTYLRAKTGLGYDDDGLERTIDVKSWKRGQVLWDGDDGWKKFIAGFTGEVMGVVHEFVQSVPRA